MEQNPISEASSFPPTQKNSPHFMEPEPQLFPTLNQINQNHTHLFFCLGAILILSSHYAYSSK